MVDLSKINKILLHPGLTDMRLGLYGLRKLVMLDDDQIGTGTLFMFCSKTKNQIKMIEITSSGAWLYQTKLFHGKYIWPSKGDKTEITKEDLRIIIEGAGLIQSIEIKDKKLSLF